MGGELEIGAVRALELHSLRLGLGVRQLGERIGGHRPIFSFGRHVQILPCCGTGGAGG
jgi:hypothetical protein